MESGARIGQRWLFCFCEFCHFWPFFRPKGSFWLSRWSNIRPVIDTPNIIRKRHVGVLFGKAGLSVSLCHPVCFEAGEYMLLEGDPSRLCIRRLSAGPPHTTSHAEFVHMPNVSHGPPVSNDPLCTTNTPRLDGIFSESLMVCFPVRWWFFLVGYLFSLFVCQFKVKVSQIALCSSFFWNKIADLLWELFCRALLRKLGLFVVALFYLDQSVFLRSWRTACATCPRGMNSISSCPAWSMSSSAAVGRASPGGARRRLSPNPLVAAMCFDCHGFQIWNQQQWNKWSSVPSLLGIFPQILSVL